MMNRAEALALVQEYTKNPSLVKHMLAVEAAMRAYARKLGEDEDKWGIVGLLHDFDYERWPDPPNHPLKGAEILRERGYPEDVIYAITHTPPPVGSLAVEIPYATKQRLRLDVERSWVMLTEGNRFIWPGPDLRMEEGAGAASVAYGLLPRALFNKIRDKFGDAVEAGLTGVVRRTQ
jgi:putative nucleotidyltransferase with HDIG domain